MAQLQRMTERDQVSRSFRCHDTGDTCNSQYITFFMGALKDTLYGLGLHPYKTFGHCDALCYILIADIDHMGLAALVEVIELVVGHLSHPV
jgi:hypothetical protein